MEENMKWKENDIVSYGEPYKKGLMNREGEILLDKDSNKFTSLIPSRNNTPHLPMVATFNKEGGAIKGVVVINQDGSYNELPFDGSRYYFIDGFDGGLARVNQINESGKKKWGIIGLSIVENELIVKEVIEPKYDELWNFYDKERKHIPAISDGSTVDISLENLRADLDKIGGRIVSTVKPKTDDEYVSITSVSMQKFKRYEEPTQIDLSSRITFVVGKNNSGKSTFLDAVELCTLNMYDLQFTETNFKGEPYFFFDKSRKDDLSVQNLLFWKYKSNTSAKTDNMELSVTSGQWTFTFKMSGSALIREISIQHNNEDTSITFRKGLVYIKMEKLYSINHREFISISEVTNHSCIGYNYIGCITLEDNFVIYGKNSDKLFYIQKNYNEYNYHCHGTDIQFPDKFSCKFIKDERFICALIKNGGKIEIYLLKNQNNNGNN